MQVNVWQSTLCCETKCLSLSGSVVKEVYQLYRTVPGSPSRHPWGDGTHRDSDTYKLGTSVLTGLWNGPGPVHDQTHEQQR